MYIRQFNNPVSQLTQVVTDLQTASAASLRVRDLMNEEEIAQEDRDLKVLENVVGNVDFDHVYFGYDPQKPIIKDFDGSFKAGSKIAIVGPTGAGKTTLINLLMRFYDATASDIKIDGTSIFEIPKANLRDQFGMVLQDTWIFEGTVLENLVYSMENISMEKVEEACERVGISHFINSLPEGYQTILDEATSSIDTRTELIIQKAMDHLMEG